MKKIFWLFGFLLVFSSQSCKDDEKFYEGDPYVHFLEESGEAFVFSDQTYRDFDIEYGTVQTVSGNPQVKITFDPTNSTAVEGVDFQILNGGAGTVPDGGAIGKFTIRILKDPATQAGKVANFKISSPTIANNLDYQTYSLTMSLTCPDSVFIGSGTFLNNQFYWYNGADTYDFVKATPDTSDEKLLIKEFWDNGDDFVVYYNPDTFKVTFPDQYTGYHYNSGGISADVYARPATDGTTSSYNPCTRRLTLRVYYYLKGTSYYFGNETEEFTGQ